jgi:hypothetical protein
MEKVQNTPRHFKFGNITVKELEPVPEEIDIYEIFKAIENHFPSHYFNNLENVVIGPHKDFEQRDANALYKDRTFFITNRQRNNTELMDDIVHEFAHHLEALYPEEIYGDRKLIDEFLKKRHELKFEIQSEGYWVGDYNFDDLKYDKMLDNFLYKRLGKNMLRMITSGIFIRPYASISLREYFATGFEAYYLNKRQALEATSPMLYDKISEIHNLTY